MDPKPPSPSSAIPILWPFKHLFYGWAIAGTALVATFAMAPLTGPVLAVFVRPIGDDLGWSRTAISLAFTIGGFGSGLFPAVIGAYLDRHGARGVMATTGIVLGGCLVGLAMMTQAWHFWLLMGIGLGAAWAGVQSAMSVAIANWFILKRGRALATGAVGLRIGQAVLPLPSHALIVALSWRHAYAVLAGMTFLLITVPAGLFIRRQPEDLGLLPDGAAPELPVTSGQAKANPDQNSEQSWTLGEARRTRALWLIVVVLAGTGFAQTAVSLHAIANFQDRGMEAILAVSITTIAATMSSVSSFGWGFLLERLHVRYGTMLVSGLFIVAMGVIIKADSYPTAVAFAVVFGVAQGGWTICQLLLLANYFGRRSLGSIRGFTTLFAGVILPLGALLAGLLRDLTGAYTIAFMTFAGVFALAFVAMLLAVPPRRPTSRVGAAPEAGPGP